jgi:spermidine synthase
MKNKYLFFMLIISLVIMAYEVLGTSFLLFFFSESSQSVSIILGIFIFGLALGSCISKKWDINIIYTNIACSIWGIAVISQYGLFNWIVKIFPNEIFIGTLYFLPLTILLGFNFQTISKFYGNANSVYIFDLIGAVIGTVLSGFLLIPVFGISNSLIGISVAFLVFNLIMLLISDESKLIKRIGLVSILIFIIILGVFVVGSGESKNLELYSKYGEVQVTYTPANDYYPALVINGFEECITYNMYSEKLMSLIATDQFNYSINVLNIGLGCGFTSQYALKSEKVQSLDIVEINPSVVELNKYFTEYNDGVLQDNRTKLIIDDGYKYLKSNKNKKYNIILVDVQATSYLHSARLFTIESLKDSKNNLNKDGILVLWVAPQIEEESIVYNTLKEVYPEIKFIEVYNLVGVLQGSLFFASDRNLNITSTEKEFLKTEIRSIERL